MCENDGEFFPVFTDNFPTRMQPNPASIFYTCLSFNLFTVKTLHMNSFFQFLNTFTNLTGQCVKTMENFFEFLQITFPRECNQTQRPSFDSMRKYMVCTSILSVTIKNEIYES